MQNLLKFFTLATTTLLLSLTWSVFSTSFKFKSTFFWAQTSLDKAAGVEQLARKQLAQSWQDRFQYFFQNFSRLDDVTELRLRFEQWEEPTNVFERAIWSLEESGWQYEDLEGEKYRIFNEDDKPR